MADEILKPEWQGAKYGDSQQMSLGALGISVSYESGSRAKSDPRPGCYVANVFGQRLKRTDPDREVMKRYALATAKQWLARSLIRLELATQDEIS